MYIVCFWFFHAGAVYKIYIICICADKETYNNILTSSAVVQGILNYKVLNIIILNYFL